MSSLAEVPRKGRPWSGVILMGHFFASSLGCEAIGDGRPVPYDAGAIADAGGLAWEPGPPSPDKDFGGDAGAAVHGQVLSATSGLPVAGVTVSVKERQQLTDQNGAFVFESVASEYDITVASCDRSHLAQYSGLTRRNPVLGFEGDCNRSPEARHSAILRGSVSGGVAFPLMTKTQIGVYVVAHETFGYLQIGGGHGEKGPTFGPLTLRWNGPSIMRARIIALGRTWSGSREWDGAMIGVSEVDLADSSESFASLHLVPVPTGTLGGTALPAERAGNAKIAIEYEWPRPEAVAGLIFAVPTGAFAFDVPDLTSFGGRYCLSVSDPDSRSRARLCGMPLGATRIDLNIPMPPAFSGPGNGANVHEGTEFSWLSSGEGIHRLRFVAVDPIFPIVDVYTARTMSKWPDLGALGISFPVGIELTCSVRDLAPFASLDVAAGPHGLWSLRAESRESDSEAILVRAIGP